MTSPSTSAVARPPLDLPGLCQAITEHAPLPMATVEGASHIVRQVNPAFCRMMGRPSKQLVGQPFTALLSEKDECLKLLDRVYRTGKSGSHTEQQQAEPHPLFWSYMMWPVLADDRPAGVMIQVTETAKFHEKTLAMNEALILGSLRQHELTESAENLNARLETEITGRKRVEVMLRRSEALFSALVAQAPVGVYVVDARFCLRQVNPTARPVFSKVRPLLGRNFSEIMHILWPKRVAGQVVRRFRHTLKTGRPFLAPNFAERRRDIGVEQIYEWQIQRVTLPGGEHGVVCFFNDITARKRAELAQRRAELLAVANREAHKDIARRQVVETTLRKNELIQRGLLAESRVLHVKLRKLTHQILTTQEEERKKISRELHDEVVQTLVGINVELSALVHGNSAGMNHLKDKITQTQRLVEKSVDAVHRFARELRPAVLDDLGLIPALHAFCQSLAERKKIKIKMTAFGGVEAMDGDKRTVLFRVAQEALNNVARHARASHVRIGISKLPGVIRLEIADNGKSFPVKRILLAKNNKRLGLVGMKERVEMVGGNLTIESLSGKGTTVRADIPFPSPPPN